MKTLVIHPQDPTTDLLKPIYEGKDWTVITDPKVGKTKLISMIKEHDRILMMGHGSGYGLFAIRRILIDSSKVYLLRDKICYGIWCNADEFFVKYALKGFYSGMIISELEEAYMYGISASMDEINESNLLFGTIVAKYIDDVDLVSKIKAEYKSDTNRVIQFNMHNLYKNS